MNEAWVWYIVSVVIGFVILEAYGWWKYGTAGTLSAHVRVWSKRWPIIVFAVGGLMIWSAYHFWFIKP